MKLRQELSRILDYTRVAAAKERLPQRVQALDAEKIFHNMTLYVALPVTGGVDE